MKTKSAIYTVLLAGLLLPILLNCKKEAIKTAPTVSITAATNITATTASAGGDITSDGGAEITIRGICWSTNQSPTTSDSKTTNGIGTGSFTGSMTGLTPGATYNVRAYATNSAGTGYSSQISFTTPALAPVLTTTVASSIISVSASSGGNITSDGGSPITARGVCWGAAQSPTTANSKTTDGSGTGIFTSAITGLAPGTTYYVRAYATNSIGTSYGNQVTLVTTAVLPIITTSAISAITSTTATSGGNITSDGGSAIIARGVCWSISANPTTANSKTNEVLVSTGSYTSILTGLIANTTYYVRAYSTNGLGTAYGSEVSFKTSAGVTGTVTDIDGNVYKTITIGTQVWMAENLKTTKFRNGDPIPNVIEADKWANLVTGAYCWYNNDVANKATYGALYNGWAVFDPRIAPTGWHVPTQAEWQTLIDYLGGDGVAGSKMKEAGTTHWLTPNTDATNSSGFTALPGGVRSEWGGNSWFEFMGAQGNWWSSTTYGGDSYYFGNYATVFNLIYNETRIAGGTGLKFNGMPVRCLKD